MAEQPHPQQSSVADLERDLHGLDRIRTDKAFAQSVYAALCNMRWAHDGLDEPWSCSWRYAGGIIAEIRDEGDYLDWYCSGIWNDDGTPEGEVTPEVAEALSELGWSPSPWPKEHSS